MSKNSSIPVHHIAKLANIPITKDEEKQFEAAFVDTLKVIEQLTTINVTGVQPTFQVTGLENVTREDVVNEQDMFSQEEALANAKEKYEGYFVVPQVISQD